MKTDRANLGKILAVTGACLQIGPLIGLCGTVAGMIGAFKTLGSNGMADPQQLSADIGGVLVATTVGLCVSLIGYILICIALFACCYRARWFYWFLVDYGIIALLFGFPLGRVLGIVILVYCLNHKSEFLSNGKPAT